MAGKKGSTWSKAMTQQQRDSIALTKIEKYIDDQIDDSLQCPTCKEKYGSRKALEPAAVALIRARYDKLRPTLSAVDQTVHEEPKAESELIQGIAEAIKSNPDLLRSVMQADPGVRPALQSLLIGGPVAVENRSEPATNAAQHGGIDQAAA